MEEIWKDIEGYEGYYQVSNMGQVRSLDRRIYSGRSNTTIKHGRILKLQANHDGYLCVKLSRDGNSKMVRVHRLVAETFLPPPESQDMTSVNHKDCNKQNNCVDNLEFCTHLQNMQHAVRMGVHGCLRDLTGPNNPNYGNTTLRDRCRANPEWSFKNHSQPGEKNYAAKRVAVTIDGVEHEFGYIGACADYLLETGLTNEYRPTVRFYVGRSARTGREYLGLQFRFI